MKFPFHRESTLIRHRPIINHYLSKAKYAFLVLLLFLSWGARAEILLILGSGETVECESLDFNELRGKIALVTDKDIKITLDARKFQRACSKPKLQAVNVDLTHYEDKIKKLKEENDNLQKEIDELKIACYDLRKTYDDLNRILAAQYQNLYIRSLPPIPSKKIIQTPSSPKNINRTLPDLRYVLQLTDLSQQRRSYRVLGKSNKSYYNRNHSTSRYASFSTRTNCSSFG